MRASTIVVAILSLGFMACGTESTKRADWPDWRDSPDSGVWRTITEDGKTCLDCLSLTDQVVIGDSEGPGYYQDSQWVTRDSLGRYWVENVDGQNVYGSTGTFIRQVGRSGEGPLEFRGVGPIFTDPVGQVHVFDQRNRRESVIAPDFELVSERPLPWGPIYDAALLQSGDRVVVNGVFREPDQIGLPLHVVDGATVVASFGMIERGLYSLGTMHMLRRVTTAPDGTVYAGGFFEYSIDVWRPSGERLLGFKRLGLWNPPPGGQPQPLSADIDLWGLLLAMHVDQVQRLWVVTWIPRTDWHSRVTQAVGPDGRTYLQPESNESLYRSALEVLDLDAGRVVARAESEELIYGFLGEGAVFGSRFLKSGEPRLVVWNVHLSRRMIEGED